MNAGIVIAVIEAANAAPLPHAMRMGVVPDAEQALPLDGA